MILLFLAVPLFSSFEKLQKNTLEVEIVIYSYSNVEIIVHSQKNVKNEYNKKILKRCELNAFFYNSLYE